MNVYTWWFLFVLFTYSLLLFAAGQESYPILSYLVFLCIFVVRHLKEIYNCRKVRESNKPLPEGRNVSSSWWRQVEQGGYRSLGDFFSPWPVANTWHGNDDMKHTEPDVLLNCSNSVCDLPANLHLTTVSLDKHLNGALSFWLYVEHVDKSQLLNRHGYHVCFQKTM